MTAATPSLWESFALVASADVLVTPDTALTHAASAFGTPACVLFQRGKEAWTPYRSPGRSVISDDARSLAQLPAERLIEALDELLAETPEV